MAHLSDVTTTELQDLLSDAKVALVPVGATEQHGPNLAMGVDWRIADALARRIAEVVAPLAVVTPTLPFGLSAHHMSFPGTVSLGFDSFRAVLLDVARSLATHGITKLVFVNGHRGNENALGVITTELTYDHGIEAASAFWISQASDVIAEHRRTERWGHACEIETSLAMALTPDLVRSQSLEAGDLIDDYGALEDNYAPFAVTTPRSFASRTRNGAFGDARLADPAVGQLLAEAAVTRTAAFVREFAERPSRLGGGKA